MCCAIPIGQFCVCPCTIIILLCLCQDLVHESGLFELLIAAAVAHKLQSVRCMYIHVSPYLCFLALFLA